MHIEREISLWEITDLAQRLLASPEPACTRVGALLQHLLETLGDLVEEHDYLSSMVAVYQQQLTQLGRENDRLHAQIRAGLPLWWDDTAWERPIL